MKLSDTTLQFIHKHQEEDIRALALQGKKYPEVDLAVALSQISGRQTAKYKIPTWYATEGIWYPRHLSLEQCSSETTASYKASVCQGKSLVDLTGGFGIDCAFLATRFREAEYVEQQEELCAIATHNFPLLGLQHIHIHHKDAVEFLKEMKPVDWIYLDPARRDTAGSKTVHLSDCTPDITQISSLLLEKADRVMIKLSPMLDITQALKQVPGVSEVHIISVKNECKELLLILSGKQMHSPLITCVHLGYTHDSSFCFLREEEAAAVCEYVTEPGRYLYEPNTSILKAGAFSLPAQKYNLKKLHPHSHLYTSDEWCGEFPGRRFEVEGNCSFHKKEWTHLMNGNRKANITVRNFPLTVAEIRKRMKVQEGGDIYLFATTLTDGKKVLIRCRKAE